MDEEPEHVKILRQSLVSDLNAPSKFRTKKITAANLKFKSWDRENKVTVFELVGQSQQGTPLSGTVTYKAMVSTRLLDDAGVASLA